MMKLNVLNLMLLLMSLLACAKNTAVQEASRTPATKYDQGTNQDYSATLNPQKWIPCGQSRTNQSPDILDGNRLYVTTAQGQRFSLCQVLMQNQTEVAIFQIAGLFCDSCQKEAKWVNQQNLTGVSHYLVLTDARNEMDAQGMNYFRQIAPRSGFFHDFDKTLANDLNYGKAFGTVVVLHRSGEYRLHLEPGLEQVWYRDAMQLAQKTSQPITQPNFQSPGGYNQNYYNQPIPSNPSNRYGSVQPNQPQEEPIYNYGFTY